MDPIPKMVIRTQLARRKGELEAASVAEIDELISTLCIAKVGMIAAAAAIAAGRLVEVALDDDDVVDATIYCGERGPWGDECALEAHDDTERHVDTSDREWGGKPFAQPASTEAVAVLADSIAAGTPLLVDDDEDGPMDDDAELRRAEKLREDWKPVLAGLGERVAVLSETPEPEWDGDPQCDSLHPSLGVVCEAHKPGLHIAPGFNEGDLDITWPREVPGMQSHRSVRLLRDGNSLVVVESNPCPEVHPSSGAPCVGGEHHGPPCRDLDGDEWVPALTAVTGS